MFKHIFFLNFTTFKKGKYIVLECISVINKIYDEQLKYFQPETFPGFLKANRRAWDLISLSFELVLCSQT